ncbi:agmatine deiminase family protein [Ensifer sp.]|uniref:agmatine deiminase family protein n=1 Tax=Ensifer sp. TaxID=1872086 RepID=UPI00289E1E4F|nr:agmatine deiminase family protein [Ensifer sp.]
MKMTDQTPRQAGFAMPAEWEPHKRTWMMWPGRRGVWDDIEATRRDYAAVAHAIREFEPVTMAVRPADVAGARALLDPSIDILETDLDDSWARDAGPCFLTSADGRRAATRFRFNAWGGKYHPYDADARFSETVVKEAGVAGFASNLVAEGGGVSVDGEGTIITTETCFPNRNRNPGWSRDEIERELLETLGGEKVIWLPGNPIEDETDGHTDGIAVFVAPGVVLMESPGEEDSPWNDYIRLNYEAMQGQTDAKGRPIRIVTVPEAVDAPSTHPKFCRSYVNSYLVNGGVIMPAYGVESDTTVRRLFQSLFPDRRVREVRIDSIAIGGGGIHCITQQEPL